MQCTVLSTSQYGATDATPQDQHPLLVVYTVQSMHNVNNAQECARRRLQTLRRRARGQAASREQISSGSRLAVLAIIMSMTIITGVRVRVDACESVS